MSGIRLEGNVSGNVAEVTATNELRTTGAATTAAAGYGVTVFETDAGLLSGLGPRRQSPSVSTDKRLQVGLDTPLFDTSFTALVQDTGLWKYTSSTMTVAQSGGYAVFNAGASTAGSIGVSMQSWRQFSLVNNGGLRFSVVCGPSLAVATNQVVEFGWYAGTAPAAAPTEGVYFRITNTGPVGVINFNGLETTTAVMDSSQIVAGATIEYQIRLYTDSCLFWANNYFLGSLNTPPANPQATMTSTLPISFQMRHTGAVVSPTQWKFGHVSIDQRDTQTGMSYETQQAGMGLMGSQATSGNTMGSTALYSNSMAPGGGIALSNTSAAIGAGLGGQFSVLPTLATNTDGILCNYLVPIGSLNVRPRTLMIKGVKVQGCVTVALVGNATPTFYAISLAYGHTAASLTTGDTASFVTSTTKSPRRIPLGYETYPITAPVGTVGSPSGIYMAFLAPIVVNPGENIAIAIKNFGSVTTSGVISFLVTFDSFWV